MSTVLIADALDRMDDSASGGEGAAATVAGLAGRLDVAPSTASRLVDRAVTAGVVERERSAMDVRQARLTLTERGRALAAEATRFRLDYLNRLTGGWDPADLAALARLLDLFASAVHDQPHPASPRAEGVRRVKTQSEK